LPYADAAGIGQSRARIDQDVVVALHEEVAEFPEETGIVAMETLPVELADALGIVVVEPSGLEDMKIVKVRGQHVRREARERLGTALFGILFAILGARRLEEVDQSGMQGERADAGALRGLRG